jgi:hypothetical protein
MVHNSASFDVQGQDLVFGNGQSNMGPFGDLLSSWPPWQQLDPNLQFATPFRSNGLWVRGSDYVFPRGMLMLSVGAQMRARGLRPSVAVAFTGGASAADLWSTSSAYCAWSAARLAEVPRVRSSTLVWSQGETESGHGTGASWLTNTRLSIAALRAAVSMPSLHVIIVQLPKSWNPQLPILSDYLTEVRAAQATLVATDVHSSLICVPNVVTVDSGVHLGQFDLDRQAQLIADNIRARVPNTDW